MTRDKLIHLKSLTCTMYSFHCKMIQEHLNRYFMGENSCRHWDSNPRPSDLISSGAGCQPPSLRLLHNSLIAKLAPTSGGPLASSGCRQPHPDRAGFDPECVGGPERVSAHCLATEPCLNCPSITCVISNNCSLTSAYCERCTCS